MNLPRSLAAVLAAAVLTPAAGRAAGPSPSWAGPSPVPSPSTGQATVEKAGSVESDEISGLLDRRAKALNEGNKRAFEETVDPQSKDFRRAQEAYFDRVKALPIKQFALTLDKSDLPPIARAADQRRYAVPAIVSQVNQRYKIEGYDATPTLRQLDYTFVLRAGRWLITSDTDLEGLGEFSDRDLWDFAPVTTRQSEHFMVMLHPDQAQYADELLASAEDALPLVDQAYPRPWRTKVPIQVPSTSGELLRMLEATFDVGNFVAFAVSALERDVDDGYLLTGHRIILNRENFLKYSPDGRKRVLAHELVHIATRPSSGPFTPSFVEEGLAQLTSAGNTTELNARVRRGSFDARLPEDWQFASGGQPAILNSYQKAYSAIDFMRRRYGLEAVDRFYESLGKAQDEPGTEHYQVDRALRETLNASFADFESAWAADVRQRRG